MTRRGWIAELTGLGITCVPGAEGADTISVTISSAGGDRLARKFPLRFGRAAEELPSIEVDETKRYQTMEGFGATFNEAGLMCLSQLGSGEQEHVLRAVFDPQAGAGFTLMKAPLAGCDFAAAGPMYFYDETPGDIELKHFSIERDLRPTGQVTFIRRARKHGGFKLQSTTDYPPDWMLDEEMRLRPDCYDAFARYLIRYLEEYEKVGITIDYLSPFNEPQEIYCRIRYSEIRDFIKRHLGPALRRSGHKTKLQVSDADNRDIGLKYFPVVLDDAEARQYIRYMPVHGYRWDRDGSEPMSRLHEKYPDLPVWQTEVCHIRETPDERRVPVYDFEDGDWWGRMLIADIRNWSAAWIYWNLILDHKGGPYMIDEKHRNPPINHQQPVIVIDTENKQVRYTGLYYYLSHFSKFVKPGAVRIASEGSINKVSFVAFQDHRGGIILEVVNSGSAETRFAVRHRGKGAEATLPGSSIGTYVWS